MSRKRKEMLRNIERGDFGLKWNGKKFIIMNGKREERREERAKCIRDSNGLDDLFI